MRLSDLGPAARRTLAGGLVVAALLCGAALLLEEPLETIALVGAIPVFLLLALGVLNA